VVGFEEEEVGQRVAAAEQQLLLVAATLAAVCSPAEAARLGSRSDCGCFGEDQRSKNPVLMIVDAKGEEGSGSLCAGELLLAPAFMSAAAEEQVEAALEVIRQQARAAKTSTSTSTSTL
jgi:hypothetical protein